MSNRVSLLVVALDDFVLWQQFFVPAQVTDSLFKFLCNLLSRNEAHRFIRRSELTISDAMTNNLMIKSFNITYQDQWVRRLTKVS